jgi:hypothetical protein
MISEVDFRCVVDHLKTRPFKYSDDGFYYLDTLNEKMIKWVESCISLGVPNIDVKIDGVAIEEARIRNKIYLGKPCRVSLIAHDFRNVGICLYKDWEEFFKRKQNVTQVPLCFYVLKTNDYKFAQEATSKVDHLIQISSFLKILEGCADYTEEISSGVVSSYVYLHKKRFNIDVDVFEPHILESLDGITIIQAKLNDESHAEQKKSILKEVLSGMLVLVPEKDRFGHIIKNFGDFSRRFSDNYDFFVSEFSFDDVRVEYEEKKRDYLSRINDVYTSSLMKMIGIPISLALMSFKMTAIVDDATFFTHLLLFLAVMIYGFMMITLVENQKHTLDALKREYTSQMNRLKFRFSDQYDLIESIVSELDDRGDFQRRCIYWYYGAVIVLIALAAMLFLNNLPWFEITNYLQDAKENILGFFSHFLRLFIRQEAIDTFA